MKPGETMFPPVAPFFLARADPCHRRPPGVDGLMAVAPAKPGRPAETLRLTPTGRPVGLGWYAGRTVQPFLELP